MKKIVPNNPYTITVLERKQIISYALKHPRYFHRELAYRMIDENIAYVSPSSCYRILKSEGLIKEHKKHDKYGWSAKYSNYASEPDELWQTDITYISYCNKDVYQLSFIDVYPRFITLSVTLTDMSSKTVRDTFEKYICENPDILNRLPRLQSDNGSCYIGNDFIKLISNYGFSHVTINPGTPTENVIIERWHRTFKELLYENNEPNTYDELIDFTQQVCHYYNYERYHKSLNYVTPYIFYREDPKKIFDERMRKLNLARESRKNENLLYYN